MSEPVVISLPDHLFLIDGPPVRRAWAVADGLRTWVFLDGQTYVIDARPAGDAPRQAHADEDAALSAPMPATVTDVRVAPGDRVARGDVLLTLEAMKMVLQVVAPRDGMVKALRCAPGDLVQPGVVLVEM